MTPQNYSKEDYLCLTDEEKLAHYFELKDLIDRSNEDLDIAQEGLLELQKELTLKRHAMEENEKLFALAKELKEENDELKKSIPNSEKEREEFQLIKSKLTHLEIEKDQVNQEKIYFAELISEYEKEAAAWKEERQALLQEAESLRNREIIDSDSELKSKLAKKEEENTLLLSEIGKIKIIVVQGMKEAKDLKNKFLTLLQQYEEINNKKREQENLVNALQSKLHETTILKNRFEQDCKSSKSEIDRLGELCRNSQESFEKELLLARQLLAKKVKESTLAQEKLEELESSYQSKIKLIISDYQDRIESLQVQNQKLLREKESALQQETLVEIKELLEPILEKIENKLGKKSHSEKSFSESSSEKGIYESAHEKSRFENFSEKSTFESSGEKGPSEESASEKSTFSGNPNFSRNSTSEERISLIPDWKQQEHKAYSLHHDE